MEADELMEMIQGQELKLEPSQVVNLVLLSAMKDDIIDCDFLQTVIVGIQSIKKSAKKDYKEYMANSKKENDEKLAKEAKEKIAQMQKGDFIQWKDSKGNQFCGTFEKCTEKRVHVILDAEGSRRFVKYESIIFS